MTDQITWLLADDGGFIVRSKSGNFAYAYPTSPHAYRAAKDAAGDCRHVAIMMATHADMDASWVPAEIVRAHNERLAEVFDAARERPGTKLGIAA